MAWAYWSKKTGAVGLPFVFEINTANTSTGSSANNQFKLPLFSTGVYDFTVDWGDSSTDIITSWDQVETTHTYPSIGIYTITITGLMEGWAFGNTLDRLKMLNISQWGIFNHLNGSGFWGCANLDVTATDVPNFGATTNLSRFFQGCTSLVYNSTINNWDVSNITEFFLTFASSPNFNQPLNNWDVSSATTLNSMFFQATSFNQPLNNWNIGNVTVIGAMFRAATAFNQDIGMWNVSNVTTAPSFMRDKTAANYSTSNLDSIYNGWSDRILVTGITISFGTIKYTSAATPARALLTRTNSTVSVSNAADNGSGLVRITTGSAHGRSTGDKIFISGITGTTEANGGWIITVIDTTNFDLQSSTFSNSYVSGGTVRIGYGWAITDGGI